MRYKTCHVYSILAQEMPPAGHLGLDFLFKEQEIEFEEKIMGIRRPQRSILE
jgi:hypothetical protein